MVKKITYLVLSLFLIGLFAFSQPIPANASRPAYALSETDQFIVDNDYELLDEDLVTAGPVTEYISAWIRPSDCYPVGPETPPCLQAFGATYSADSNSEQYDEAFYNNMRQITGYPGFEEITEDVPGAGIAFLYTPSPSVYSAIAYFGFKTGISVVVAETVPMLPDSLNYEIQSSYDKSGMKEILVAIGEKAADVLDLDTKKGPGFTAVTIIGTMTVIAVVFRKYRKK
ncbi:MAG: hypothetical protein GF308_17655 [Candidatus Heimdallarchaeota archaeon]|nr:hypothetical protein [Candidatus Heimdallarchaeota archaeon]